MKISKRQLRRIIKEEKQKILREQFDDEATDVRDIRRAEMEQYGDGDPDGFDVETSLSALNDALYSALPAAEELMGAIQSGDWVDDDAMKTLINQFDEFTYDAFGEYLIDKRKLQRLSRPRK
jgi:hypothetical protein